MNLDDQLAIIVGDVSFKASLRDSLSAALDSPDWTSKLGAPIQFVESDEACATLNFGGRKSFSGARVILDTIGRMDGLERLMVMFLADLGCRPLLGWFRPVVGQSGLVWATFRPPRLFWDILGQSGLFWATYYRPICVVLDFKVTSGDCCWARCSDPEPNRR